jgi:hypothetical protein
MSRSVRARSNWKIRTEEEECRTSSRSFQFPVCCAEEAVSGKVHLVWFSFVQLRVLAEGRIIREKTTANSGRVPRTKEWIRLLICEAALRSTLIS